MQVFLIKLIFNLQGVLLIFKNIIGTIKYVACTFKYFRFILLVYFKRV